MDKTRIMILGTLLFAATMLTFSSETMRMTDEWRDKTFQGPPYKKIMVIALTKRADLRQPMEDEFSRQITARAGEAVACHVLHPRHRQGQSRGAGKSRRGHGD